MAKPSIQERVFATAKLEVSWMKAPVWKRIAAFVFDMFLIQPVNVYFSKYGSLVTFLITAAYFIGLEQSPWQGTVGKRMMSLKVVSEEGGKVPFIHTLLRYLVKIPSLVALGIGYWPLLGKSGKEAVPDRVGHTQVIALTPVRK